MKKLLADKLPAIVQSLVENGIPVTIEDEGFLLGGFYKHGSVLLYPVEAPERGNHEWEIVDRYDKKHPIHMFSDIVELNYDIWNEDYDPGIWGPLLIKYGHLEAHTETITTYKRR